MSKKCPKNFLGYFRKVPNLLVSLKVFGAFETKCPEKLLGHLIKVP
jgi:hypothetical protein